MNWPDPPGCVKPMNTPGLPCWSLEGFDLKRLKGGMCSGMRRSEAGQPFQEGGACFGKGLPGLDFQVVEKIPDFKGSGFRGI